MPSVILYFRIHIPHRVQGMRATGAGSLVDACDNADHSLMVHHLADTCYLPANALMKKLITNTKGRFKLAFSISGTTLDVLQQYRPDVIQSFRELAQTGCIEFTAETYYNSFSWLHSKPEFSRQVHKHSEAIRRIFGLDPIVFRNTDLIYNNELAGFVADMGYSGILCEGLDNLLRGRTRNRVYACTGNENIGILIRNAALSDDIAFRFDDASWNQHPLTAMKFAGWIHQHSDPACCINLFFDYETFGIHKKPSSGILEFLEQFPTALLEDESWTFKKPSEALEACYLKDVYDSPDIISWHGHKPESFVWNENVMQHNALKKIYRIEKIVLKSHCEKSLDIWGRLQSAENFFYMGQHYYPLKAGRYHNPFASPADAFKAYDAIVSEFELSLIEREMQKQSKLSARRHAALSLF